MPLLLWIIGGIALTVWALIGIVILWHWWYWR
jgi:hypothetical protein